MFRLFELRDTLRIRTPRTLQGIPLIAVDQQTISCLLDAEPESLKQWDNAFRMMLNIDHTSKYLIVDIGKQIGPDTYSVPCLCASSAISDVLQSGGRLCKI